MGYYTGAIFDVYDPALGAPIGGGGRYDDLLGRFGRGLPAVGWDRFSAAWGDVFAAKVAAAGTNVVTFVFAFGLLLVPGIARAIWSRRSRPDVRAYGGLLVLVNDDVQACHRRRAVRNGTWNRQRDRHPRGGGR